MEKTLRRNRRRDLLMKTSAISIFCTLLLAMAAPFATERQARSASPEFVPYKARDVIQPARSEMGVKVGLLQE